MYLEFVGQFPCVKTPEENPIGASSFLKRLSTGKLVFVISVIKYIAHKIHFKTSWDNLIFISNPLCYHHLNEKIKKTD